jgi:two-component system, OmpR family, phosphate regulon response regulator OmpR
LIIDDEENLRRTLTRILISAGWNVTGAANAAEALKLASQNHFDLVYLDLRLPDMHGLEILKEIRKIDDQLPVIVLTAYGTMNSAVQSMHLGVTDYLLKPVEPDVLIAHTESILQKRYKDKRRKEIQDQIAALQGELASLEKDALTALGQPPPVTDSSRFLHKGKITIDLRARKASLADAPLELPPATFEYLVVLCRHAPEIVRYQTLVSEAQGYQANYSEARELTKWHIHVIRQAIEENPRKPRYLLNVRGTGYQLITG